MTYDDVYFSVQLVVLFSRMYYVSGIIGFDCSSDKDMLLLILNLLARVLRNFLRLLGAVVCPMMTYFVVSKFAAWVWPRQCCRS